MLAQIWNKRGWVKETGKERLVEICDKALKVAGFKILGELEYNFTPQGYTKLYLLAESHFAIHTFPEEGKTYIELSSCNEEKYRKCIEMITFNLDLQEE